MYTTGSQPDELMEILNSKHKMYLVQLISE